jgi:hypothetical protein
MESSSFITTFFAREVEAKVIDSSKLRFVEAVGCEWITPIGHVTEEPPAESAEYLPQNRQLACLIRLVL